MLGGSYESPNRAAAPEAAGSGGEQEGSVAEAPLAESTPVCAAAEAAAPTEQDAVESTAQAVEPTESTSTREAAESTEAVSEVAATKDA